MSKLINVVECCKKVFNQIPDRDDYYVEPTKNELIDKTLEQLKLLKQKDQRIAELEKEIESIGRLCDKLNNDYEEINKNNIHQTRELTQAERELKYCMQENTKLEAKLENAIVPKFNFGDTIFAVVTYIDDPKDKTVIESGIVQKIECDKNQIKYWCDNGRIYWEDECEKLFATEQEAQQKLKELEEK